MNKKALLTIAIPTYSRSSSLKLILDELIRQLTEEVEVLVSDDCSTDDTESVVRTYQKTDPRIVYHRNKVNLGFNGNICALYEMSQTKYIWYVCDDDTVLPGAIDTVLKALKKYTPSVAVFNTKWINAFGQDQVAGVEKTILHDDLSLLTDYQCIMRTTFLSIDVFEKRKSIEELKKTAYKDNIFFQLSLTVFLLSDSFRFLEVSSKPIIRRNVGFKYGEFIKFNVIDHLKAVFITPHILDNAKFVAWSIGNIPSVVQLYLSRKLGLFLYVGSPSKETLLQLHTYYGIYAYLIRSLPLISFLIPRALLKLAYFFRLYTIHGYRQARKVYNQNINRIYRDTRKTEFTSYQ